MSLGSSLVSGLKSAGKTVGNDALHMTGNIEKAIIEILDVRGRKDKGPNQAVDVQGKANGGANKAFADEGLAGDYLTEQEGKEQGGLAGEIKGETRRLFTVQFNPNSLQLSGNAGGLIQKTDYTENMEDKKGGVSYAVGATNISLSVSLLFDHCDAQDAFMSDKFSLAPTTVATGIAKAALTPTGLKKVSVQKEVEGFIAALRNRYTRLITFHWGEFNYSGILRNVSATYTMFNVLGEPVRANVSLNISCADGEQYPNSLTVWQERYKTAFKAHEARLKGLIKADKGSTDYMKFNQIFGNIINL